MCHLEFSLVSSPSSTSGDTEDSQLRSDAFTEKLHSTFSEIPWKVRSIMLILLFLFSAKENANILVGGS